MGISFDDLGSILQRSAKYALSLGTLPSIVSILALIASGGCCAGTDTALRRLGLILGPGAAFLEFSGMAERIREPLAGILFFFLTNMTAYFLFFIVFFVTLETVSFYKGLSAENNTVTDYCPRCGAEIPMPRAYVCRSCGAALMK